jgi:hypothetical protein
VSGYTLGFSHLHSYSSFPAITVPVVLTSDLNTSVDCQAKVDTGSTYCIFEKRYAEWLDLDLSSGTLTPIETPTGSFYCYGHELTVSVFDIEWQAVFYFAEHDAFRTSVVGRVGFLDRLKVGIVDYDQLLYLSLYDES